MSKKKAKKKSKVNLRYNCAENVSLIERFNGECAVAFGMNIPYEII